VNNIGGVLGAAIQQFYELRSAPPEVHVPSEPDEREALEAWLSDRAGRRVKIVVPQRGEKRSLVDLANRNAALAYVTRFNQTTAARYDALEMLQHVLGLSALPRRIECFDISTIQGSETVASMVVCEDGRMRRGEYRKFRIRGTGQERLRPRRGPQRGTRAGGGTLSRDMQIRGEASASSRWGGPRASEHDFAAMHEVVLRRYRKARAAGPFPT
jgi:excinuclease ABC subunit C